MNEIFFGQGKVYLDPVRFLHFTDFLSPELALALAEEFPVSEYRNSVGIHERYRHLERTIFDPAAGIAAQDLSDNWARLVEKFKSHKYQTWVQEHTKQDLSDKWIKIRLYRYLKGDWMSPHLDPEDRLTTHLIFLTPDWKLNWGGCLKIMQDCHDTRIVHEFPPVFNSSILFCNHGRPFHSVSHVGENATAERRLIIAQFVA